MDAVDELNLLLGIGPGKGTKLPITLTKSGYVAVKPLGKGGFGQAHLVYQKDSKKYFVVKHINLMQLSSRQRKDAHNEIHILQSLHHPNIVRYCEFCEEHPHLYIMMEYADGGDLAGHLEKLRIQRRRLSEEQLVSLFAQTCLAVKYLHDRRILHRDIKSQNVFMTKAHVVKLGDFGISTVLQSTAAMARTMCGTPCFFSPELCQGRPYNSKSDIWALGILLFEMATLSLPFDGREMKSLMQAIVTKEAPHLPATQYSPELDDLCQWMLSKDPADRPDVVQVLRHPAVASRLPSLTEKLEVYTSRPASSAGGVRPSSSAGGAPGVASAAAAAAFSTQQPQQREPPQPPPRPKNFPAQQPQQQQQQVQDRPPQPPPRPARPAAAPLQQQQQQQQVAAAPTQADITSQAAAAYARAQQLVVANRRDVSPAAAASNNNNNKQQQQQQQQPASVLQGLAHVDQIVADQRVLAQQRDSPPPPSSTAQQQQQQQALEQAAFSPPPSKPETQQQHRHGKYDEICHVMLADSPSLNRQTPAAAVAAGHKVGRTPSQPLAASPEEVVEIHVDNNEQQSQSQEQEQEEQQQQQQQQKQEDEEDELARVIDELRETLLEKDKEDENGGDAEREQTQREQPQQQQQQQQQQNHVQSVSAARPSSRPVSRSSRFFVDARGTSLNVKSLIEEHQLQQQPPLRANVVVASAAPPSDRDDGSSSRTTRESSSAAMNTGNNKDNGAAASESSATSSDVVAHTREFSSPIASSSMSAAAGGVADGVCLCGACTVRVPLAEVIGSFVATDSFTIRSSGNPAGVEYLHLPDRTTTTATEPTTNAVSFLFQGPRGAAARVPNELKLFSHVEDGCVTRVFFCGTCATKVAIVNLPGARGTCVPRGILVVDQSRLLDQFTVSP